MAIGSRRSRNGDEYVFVDGRALSADEVVRIDVGTGTVPGQGEGATVPGQRAGEEGHLSKTRSTLEAMASEDALAVNEGFRVSLTQAEALMVEDRRILHRKYLVFGIVLALVALASLCISHNLYFTLYSPAEVAASLREWVHLAYLQVANPSAYAHARAQALQEVPMYQDVFSQLLDVLKFMIAGVLLALSGMLYQNTFRNPIAAPSMLGVSNGISFALLGLVLAYGTAAVYQTRLYYLVSIAGGVVVLLLVLLGGKAMSGKGRFNVVNLILMGTVISQFLGAIVTYVQNALLTADAFTTYYLLQTAAGLETSLVFTTLGVGLVVSLIPVLVFRFRLNLISFSDEEVRLLGVDPTKLRLLALGCGSVMILAAQVNLGQVAMASLVVPFVVRAVFGSEFRKQVGGNILVGALLLLVCGDVTSCVSLWGVGVDIGSAVTILVMPLFVWMLAIRQRSWGE